MTRRAHFGRKTRRESVSGGLLAFAVPAGVWLVLVVLLVGRASGQCRYEPVIIDTGICESSNEPARFNQYAINDKGEIAGLAGCFPPFFAPVVWPGEGALQGLPVPAGFGSFEIGDMSNTGIVVGGGATSPSTGAGLVWRDGEVIVIQPLLDGQSAPANGVNDRGQVVGHMQSGITGSFRAYLWEDGVATNLNPILGAVKASASDVNEHRQITGWTGESIHVAQAFILTGDEVTLLPLLPGALNGRGFVINRHGHVAGAAVMEDADGIQFTRGFYRDGRKLLDLGTIEPNIRTSVNDLNDLDQIIGGTSGTEYVPYIWQHGHKHKLYELIPPQIIPQRPFPEAINNRGEIAVSGVTPAVFLRPINPPIGDINKDCVVNVSDLLMLLADWGTDIGYVDIDGSGAVDVFDLLQLLTHWGEDNSVN